MEQFSLLVSSAELAKDNFLEELSRRLHSSGYLERLCREIRELLQIVSSRPESGCSEVFEGENGMPMIHTIEKFFLKTKYTTGNLHRLYRKYVTTPDNLAALCQITNVRVGIARCEAAAILMLLCEERIVWKIKMRDGTPFAVVLFRTLGKILDPNATDHGKVFDHCVCFYMPWRTLDSALLCFTGDNCELISALSTQDWKTKFDSCRGATEFDSCRGVDEQFYGFSLLRVCSYNKILWRAFQVLKLDESNSQPLRLLVILDPATSFVDVCLSISPELCRDQQTPRSCFPLTPWFSFCSPTFTASNRFHSTGNFRSWYNPFEA